MLCGARLTLATVHMQVRCHVAWAIEMTIVMNNTPTVDRHNLTLCDIACYDVKSWLDYISGTGATVGGLLDNAVEVSNWVSVFLLDTRLYYKTCS